MSESVLPVAKKKINPEAIVMISSITTIIRRDSLSEKEWNRVFILPKIRYFSIFRMILPGY